MDSKASDFISTLDEEVAKEHIARLEEEIARERAMCAQYEVQVAEMRQRLDDQKQPSCLAENGGARSEITKGIQEDGKATSPEQDDVKESIATEVQVKTPQEIIAEERAAAMRAAIAAPYVEETDREVLINMFNSCNGKSWHRSKNWCTSEPLSKW